MVAKRRKSRSPRHRAGNRRGGSGGRPPVRLSKRSSSHFQPKVRDRGAEHHGAGRVEMEIDGTRGHARVIEADGTSWAVGLDWTRVPGKRALHSFCECPTFASGEACEHVWAMLLAFDGEGLEMRPEGRDRISLRKDRADRWGELTSGKEKGRTPNAALIRPKKGRGARRGRRGGKETEPGTSSWRSQLTALREEVIEESDEEVVGEEVPASPDAVVSGIRFLVNTRESLDAEGLVIDLFVQRRGSGGKPGRIHRTSVDPTDLSRMIRLDGADGAGGAGEAPTAEDVESLGVVTAWAPVKPRGRGKRGKSKGPSGVRQLLVPRRLCEPLLLRLAAAGTLGWWDGRRPSAGKPLAWDEGPAWQLAVRLEPTQAGPMRLRGCLERNGESVGLDEPLLILPGGPSGRPHLVFFRDRVAPLVAERDSDLPWIARLRDADEIIIPRRDLEDAYAVLFAIPDLPRLDIPEELRLSEETSEPVPRLMLSNDAAAVIPNAPLQAELSFLYGDLEVDAGEDRSTMVDWDERTFVRRDMEREHQELVRLLEAGVRPLPAGQGHQLELPSEEVPRTAEKLLAAGWVVEVQGRSVRPANPPALRIESGIDWFELSGDVDFGGEEVDLKKILEAVRKGDRFVRLSDGSPGLLPSAWSDTYGSLTDLAQDSTDDGLRFLPSQALLVDALLTEMPAAAVDEAFAELRDKLRSFDRIKPKKEPRGFRGELRAYQREGLGWLDFLREFGLGGVLADDMGLGKTVQVLALLRAHRTPKKSTGLPWLVVVPRSLLYNWLDEAERFTPNLKVIEYGGPGREALQGELGNYDLVTTTYGTLRRDIGFLGTVEFDTVVLDEAQAIKNPESLGAKAARALRARHRLALTGTPIENHLGELGSLFEFLNPGLLGRLPTLDVLSSGRKASAKELERVRQGVKPFILRRTKAHVLPDLPPKTEQVLQTGLNRRQRELYDQLRAGYQASLLESGEKKGNALEVLEALLRLRQIACHPGLVNDEWKEAGSAKLDALFELVDEVLDEGHKVLVFSQFTQLLALVRERLDPREVPYAYLDGQTRNRGEVVDRFQNDPDCNLFLISLKAGGVGLNLTAAGYVFLLDPWWNPAVEAQAIDRAHRIGQTQPVFAYRLIAQDTVEEKILELQRSKKQIADAILEGDGEGPVSQLTAEDLKMLLS